MTGSDSDSPRPSAHWVERPCPAMLLQVGAVIPSAMVAFYIDSRPLLGGPPEFALSSRLTLWLALPVVLGMLLGSRLRQRARPEGITVLVLLGWAFCVSITLVAKHGLDHNPIGTIVSYVVIWGGYLLVIGMPAVLISWVAALSVYGWWRRPSEGRITTRCS